jgi:arylsulfatase A-like enzyme
MAGEDKTAGQLGNTFPKTVTGGEASPGPKFYDAFENTPFSNEVLADFAETAIEREKLGTRAGITDLLCLSFSANDHIGHLYGPDSHEIMDNVVRMDRTLAEFFAFLDRRVGLRHCTIVLTADHGASPMPEYLHSINPNVPAGRINGAQLINACEAALNRAFGPLKDNGRWVVRDDGYFLIHPDALAEKKVDSAAAQTVVRDALLALDFVRAAYTRTQLERGDVSDDLGRQALLSFNRERGGDVYFQAKPYYFSKDTGTNHSTPYNYDTHVPLVWFGVGVKPGTYAERVQVADLAPTLAHLLGIPAPPEANGRVLF